MADVIIMDACSLLAFIYNEDGADIVKGILKQAEVGDSVALINKVNLYEVYYDLERSSGKQQAEEFYDTFLKLPIEVINGISDEVMREASRMKATYRMSLADSIALGEALTRNAAVLTADHHEFGIVEQNESIAFIWIR
ncbi:MAG: PIN domain-containing protein [Oscillospiraceae bacterium]|nr:PIN domain-containing protein [Oscillospiraceae bacterium]